MNLPRARLRSRKVRRILRLEAQITRWRARQARHALKAGLFQRRADALLAEAHTLELHLTGGELGELRRARAAAAPARDVTTPGPTAPRLARSATPEPDPTRDEEV